MQKALHMGKVLLHILEVKELEVQCNTLNQLIMKKHFIGIVLNCHNFLKLGVPEMVTFLVELPMYDFLK